MPLIEPIRLLMRDDDSGVDMDWIPKSSDSATKKQVFTYPLATDRPIPKPAPVFADI